MNTKIGKTRVGRIAHWELLWVYLRFKVVIPFKCEIINMAVISMEDIICHILDIVANHKVNIKKAKYW